MGEGAAPRSHPAANSRGASRSAQENPPQPPHPVSPLDTLTDPDAAKPDGASAGTDKPVEPASPPAELPARPHKDRRAASAGAVKTDPGAARPPRTPPPSSTGAMSAQRTAGWVLVGVAGASAIAFAAMIKPFETDVSGLQPAGALPSIAARQSTQALAGGAEASAAVALASAAVAAILLTVPEASSQRTAIGFTPLPSGGVAVSLTSSLP